MSKFTVNIESKFNPSDLVFHVVAGGSIELGVVSDVRLDGEKNVVYDIRSGGIRAVSVDVPEGNILCEYPSNLGAFFNAININMPTPDPTGWMIAMKILNDSGHVVLGDMITIDEHLDKLRTPWNQFGNSDFVVVHDKMEGGAGTFYLYRELGYDRIPTENSKFNVLLRKVFANEHYGEPVGFDPHDEKVLLFTLPHIFTQIFNPCMKSYVRQRMEEMTKSK